jgi:predicted RNase H-like nuclease (RuvC/YqgF family)
VFYTKSHVKALEGQIADLKAQLEEARKTQPQVCALEAQIADLKAMLADERKERQALLDRLLSKNNVQPIQEVVKPQTVVEMVTPWGAAMPEIEDSLKASFIAEEKAWLISQGHSDERAQALAEQEYRSRHEVIAR